MRIFGILAGYEDQNDHDTLRTDPVFKLVNKRVPTDNDLVSQPTMSRFENQINIPSSFRPRVLFVEQFIVSVFPLATEEHGNDTELKQILITSVFSPWSFRFLRISSSFSIFFRGQIELNPGNEPSSRLVG